MVKRRRKTITKSATNKTSNEIKLPPTAIQNLSQIAKEAGLSKSELVEGVVKGEIAIDAPSADTLITIEPIEETAEQALPSEETSAVVDRSSHTPKEISDRQLEQQNRFLQTQLQQKTNLIASLEKQLTERQAQQVENQQKFQQQLSDRDGQKEQLQKQLDDRIAQIERQLQSQQALQQQLSDRDKKISELQNSQQQAIALRDREISELQRQLTEKQAQLHQQSESNQNLSNQL
ncbi:MAG: hypothetical protein ACRC2V_26910, partial [Xenococcaceae cyanobacterium]